MERRLRGQFLRVGAACAIVLVTGCTSIEPRATSTSEPSSAALTPGSSAPAASIDLATAAPSAVATATAITDATLAPATPGSSATATSTPGSAATPSPTGTPKPTSSPTPTPSPTPKPAKIKSVDIPDTVDCNVDPQPYTINISWSIANATGVTISIDGGGIYDSYPGAQGTAEVPFACGEPEHTYLLTTTGGEGAAAHKKYVVSRARPVIDEFYGPTVSDTGPCTHTYQVNLHWIARHATGIHIETNGHVVGDYSGASGSVQVNFDCTKSNPQTFVGTTIAPYGPQDSAEATAFYNGS